MVLEIRLTIIMYAVKIRDRQELKDLLGQQVLLERMVHLALQELLDPLAFREPLDPLARRGLRALLDLKGPLALRE